MPKIAVDARKLSSSTGRYIDRLLHYLQEVDTTNTYIVLLRPQDMDKWKSTNPNFTSVACPYKEFSLSEQIGFAIFLRKLNVDLVHFGMVQQPLLYFGKHVTTMHDLTTTRFTNPAKNKGVYLFKQQVYRFVNWYVPRSSKAIITPTEFVKNDVVKFSRIKKSKITVTHEAADEILDAIEPIKSLQAKPFIFYVGRPQPHKNLGRLLEAFAILKKSNPDLLLVLAGRKDAVYESFLKQAEKLGIDDSVVFTGYVTEGQLKWLYRGCKAYVFPSLSEGFGLPGLEAMVHHAPVVSSDATCLPEVYGDAAWYFNPLDVHDIARSISEVLKNTELRKDLIRRGVKQASKYSWKKMAEETLEVYEKALKN